MKHTRRILSVLMALVLCLCSLNLKTVYASDADDTWYSDMFLTPTSAYYLVCQPDSAITLTDDVNITPAMLSDNYKGGVVDLPRLQADYKYVLSTDNPNFMLPATLYPTLAWNTEAIGTDVTLYIVDTDDIVKYSVSVAIEAKYTTLLGINHYYKEVTTEVAPDGTTTESEEIIFHDASENLVNTLVNEGDNMRYYNTSSKAVTVYDHEMHKTSIVMSKYMYTPDDVSAYGRLSEYNSYFTYANFDDIAYNFSKVEGDAVVTKYNIKDYAKIMNNGTRPGLLFYGSKTKDCVFDNNTGDCTTTTGIDDVDALYYFIATNEECYFSKITGACTRAELATPLPDTPLMSWTVGKTYSLKSGSTWLEAGFTSNPAPDNPNYLRYGPVDVGSQFNYHLQASLATDYNADEIKITPSSDYCHDCNYYALSLVYNAAIPHLGSCTMKIPSYEVTLNYYYKTPSEDTWTFLKTQTYNASQFANAELEKLPELDNYTDDTWYTDTGFNIKLNPASFSKTQSRVLNVYGQYKYSNGYYHVVFIDDNAGTKDTKTFKVSEQPVLPETPDAPTGYDFADWMVVNNPGDTSGVSYDASSFNPSANVTYYFRAVWATKGVISGIELTKDKYYVGESLDKTTITVYVRSDDTGNVVKASSDSYEFDNEVVRCVGYNAITISYKSTNYKYTFYVEGLERKVESIEAEYTGGKVKVGSTYNPGAFTITATYSDKSTAEVTDFSINPTTCSREGDNTVTINYLDVSTTCIVTGIKADEYKATVPIDSITASYKGKKLNVGDKIKAGDITVVVSYVNGERITLAPSDFTFSPTVAEYEGDMRVTCSFKSVEGSCIVPVKKKPVPDTTPDGSTGSQDNTHTDNPSDGSHNSGTTPTYPTDDDNTSNGGSSIDISDLFPDNSTGGSTGGTSTDSNNGSTNNNSTQGNQNGTSDNTHGEDDKTDGKGTSPGYLNGANILTNTLGIADDIEMGYTTLLNLCKTADKKQSLFVSLINNRTGNTLTKECLKLVKEKDLTLYITMTDASDKLTTVASWVVLGNMLDNTDASLDMNVMFEKTDKTGERLLYIAPSSAYYPMGLTLSVSPLNTYYGSGDLIRQYSCTPAYTDCKQMRAFAWEENNYIAYDLYSERSICLSDSRYVYADGSSLLDDPAATTSQGNTEETPTEETTEGTGEDPFDDIDWGNDDTKHKSNKTIILVSAIVLIAIAGVSTTSFLLLRKKR